MESNFSIESIIENAAEKAAFKVVALIGGIAKTTTETPKDGGLLSKDEVKVMCGGITDMTLSRWDKSGYLPKTRVGRKIFYRVEDVARITGQKGGQA